MGGEFQAKSGIFLELLGDPRQLEQPIQGSHPEGTDVSALDHLLGEGQTIHGQRGLFLEETWRLHPDICRFTSEIFYEKRLHSRPGLEKQRIISAGPIEGSGLRLLPVTHDGNQSSSPEEAERVRALVQNLLDQKSEWVDMEGNVRPLTLNHVLIIAPYNAQVFELQEHLPGARIGTVDKFGSPLRGLWMQSAPYECANSYAWT
jgi:superfamily I DNA and/or RNA helicase